jgi:hypothetical protein
MIDIFTVVVPHALMAIAIWRLIHRDDLNSDPLLPVGEQAAASKAASNLRGFGRTGNNRHPRA